MDEGHNLAALSFSTHGVVDFSSQIWLNHEPLILPPGSKQGQLWLSGCFSLWLGSRQLRAHIQTRPSAVEGMIPRQKHKVHDTLQHGYRTSRGGFPATCSMKKNLLYICLRRAGNWYITILLNGTLSCQNTTYNFASIESMHKSIWSRRIGRKKRKKNDLGDFDAWSLLKTRHDSCVIRPSVLSCGPAVRCSSLLAQTKESGKQQQQNLGEKMTGARRVPVP